MIKVLEYRQITVDKAVIIELPKDVEVIVRKKKIRRNFFRIIKDILSVNTRDSYHKDAALSEIHDRIIFK